MDLKDGLYEQVINEVISKTLESIPSDEYEISRIDQAESKVIFSKYVSKILESGLALVKERYKESGLEEQLKVCNEIIEHISKRTDDNGFLDLKISENTAQLFSINRKRKKIQRPETPLSISSLFTGNRSDPLMVDELKREIRTSDRVDIIVSFIKFSGLRLILDDLRDFSEKGKLRIITTTYMGATEKKAVVELSKLPNTEVKIAYNVGNTRLHAKSYIFHRDTGFSVAYVGSSNLSSVAVTEGKEWNIKITNEDLPHIFENLSATFEAYWNSYDFETFVENDGQRLSAALNAEKNQGKVASYVLDVIPRTFQQKILDELDAERKVHGRFKNLLVAATGTGKTVISAFDYRRFCEENPGKKNRLLYVAHRKEILEKSLSTFRAVLKDGNFGRTYYGTNKPDELDHLFMTVQTFNSQEFHNQTPSDYYDYIIVDETHHSAASSYQKIFTHYTPKILLGLTATPERMDGVNILDYFGDTIASEIRLTEAIDKGYLVPFQYFCISDIVDLSSIKFEKGKYDAKSLTDVYVNNSARAGLILNTLEKYSSDVESIKALGFCVTKEHARFMADSFNAVNVPSIALTDESSNSERETAQTRLNSGEIKVIFTVDLYNEGVDIPKVNTVLFLRPTESMTIFVQQLGRGLRTDPGKTELTVFDFIGQANQKYSFKNKFEILTAAAPRSLENQIKNGFSNLPNGCYIHMEKLAKEHVLKNLKLTKTTKSKLVDLAMDYKSETGKDITLAGFLRHYGISLEELYSSFTFTKLCELAKIRSGSLDDDKEKLYKKGFMNLSSMDDKEWIISIKEILSNGSGTYNSAQEKTILMLYYSFYIKGLLQSGFETLNDFIASIKNDPIFDELMQLLNYQFEQIHFVDKHVELGFESTLNLHCTYTRYQALAGLGISTRERNVPLLEGAHYAKDLNTDIFFVTIRKSEKDFSPTTMYEDYAINDVLFHWQSQSKTSEDSPTGMRYRNQRKSKHNVILFVREAKEKNDKAMPYVFLGKMSFVSHEGSKPMSIVWELEQPMPPGVLEIARIIKE